MFTLVISILKLGFASFWYPPLLSDGGVLVAFVKRTLFSAQLFSSMYLPSYAWIALCFAFIHVIWKLQRAHLGPQFHFVVASSLQPAYHSRLKWYSISLVWSEWRILLISTSSSLEEHTIDTTLYCNFDNAKHFYVFWLRRTSVNRKSWKRGFNLNFLGLCDPTWWFEDWHIITII